MKKNPDVCSVTGGTKGLPLACALAEVGDLSSLQMLPREAMWIPDRHGSGAIHWAAGSGHLETLIWLVAEVGMDAESDGLRAHRRSKRRRPLHYAARNGHLETCLSYAMSSASTQTRAITSW